MCDKNKLDAKGSSVNDLVEGIDFIYVHSSNSVDIRRDPKDFDPKYKEILDKAFSEAEAEYDWKGWAMMDIPVLQKKILKEKYGIVWRSIYELNPERKFD